MSIQRKEFLRYSSLGVAAGLLATSPGEAVELLAARSRGHALGAAGALEVTSAPMDRAGAQERPAAGDWEAVRARFAIDRSCVCSRCSARSLRRAASR